MTQSTTINVMFFARLRELAGDERLEFSPQEDSLTVDALREHMIGVVPADLAEALRDPNVFCAVNQRVVDGDYALGLNDEIAFFPPMTGG